MNVAVIGGGYAGLSAAVELAQAGIPVTVYESAKQLGGRARRVEYRGETLDNGQHLLLGAYRELLRLMKLVGAEQNALLRLPLQLEFPAHFSLTAPRLPAPLHLLYALATAHGLSTAQRLAALRFMLALRRDGFRLPADISVAALLENHRQTGAIRRFLWEPLCLAALNTPLENASAQVFLNVLRDSFTRRRADSDMLLPCVDATRLFPEPAARYIAQRGGVIRLGTPVRSIVKENGGFSVVADQGARHFSQVVCAVAPQRLAGLAGKLPELAPALHTVSQFAYQPIYSLYLRYPASIALPAPLLGMSGGLTQWVFGLGQMGRSKGLLAAVISAAGAHEKLGRDQLALRVHQELCGAFGNLPPPLWTEVIAEKRATFACSPALERPPQATPLHNFHLAGDYTAGEYPATLEGAIRSGIKVARIILNSEK
ncbi:MAG: FAD-dependent oxidoreductase [Betaproteobacteria bacterium]|nr:MAG: FAD-dependent oxidoreductase [Betaproteobacteria bacterium]